MRFVGEIGHLEASVKLLPGVTAKGSGGEVRISGSDRAGKPWTLLMAAIGGLGWTSVFTNDFDADGQTDLLIGAHFPGVGTCVDGASVTLLLFDQGGRPVPWAIETRIQNRDHDQFPFVPVLAVDANRNGRAEFVLTECSRERGYAITSVYEARDGGLHLADTGLTSTYRKAAGGLPSRKWISHWFHSQGGEPQGKVTERIETLHDQEFGCEAMQPPPEPLPPPKPGQHYGVSLVMGPCGEPRKAETILTSGRALPGFPAAFIWESAEKGREIDLRGGLLETMRIMRYGYRVRPTGNQGWYWVDLDSDIQPGRVEVDIEVFQTRRIEIPHTRQSNGCVDLLYDNRYRGLITVRQCGSKSWRRAQDGSEESIEGVLAKGGHTAAQHTVNWATRFERPPGSSRLLARAESGLTRWGSATSHALHDSKGALLAFPVKVPFDAELLFGADALVFAPRESKKLGEAIEVRGRMRWRVLR